MSDEIIGENSSTLGMLLVEYPWLKTYLRKKQANAFQAGVREAKRACHLERDCDEMVIQFYLIKNPYE